MAGHGDEEVAAVASATKEGRATSDRAGYGFDRVFLRRIWKLQPLLFPRALSCSAILLAVVAVLAAGEQFLAYPVGLISGQYYEVLGKRDLPAFRRLAATSLATIVGMVVVKSLKVFATRSLTVVWRRTLGHAIHQRYFQGINYYHLNVLKHGNLDNPDQRMTADVNLFCSTYGSILVDLLLAPFTISYYSYQAYSRAGWPGPTAMFGLFLVSAVVNKLLMSPVVAATVEQEKREGDFRFRHVAVRVNSESLAFYGSAGEERRKVNLKLDSLCDVQQQVFNRKFALDLATSIFDYFGSIASYLVIAVPIFSGAYASLDGPELSKKISENSFVCMYLFYQFSKLVDLAGTVTGVAGATHRVVELIEQLRETSNAPHKNQGGEKDSGEGDGGDDGDVSDDGLNEVLVGSAGADGPSSSSDGLLVGQAEQPLERRRQEGNMLLCQLVDLSIGAPESESCLISRLCLEVRSGTNVLIVGPSSSGKTSLLRTLRGLWDPLGGVIERVPRADSVFFLPQKPFLTNGSLLNQFLYPGDAEQILREEKESGLQPWIENVVEDLDLSDLQKRCGGLDVDPGWSDWGECLSPGEAQRVAFARLLVLARRRATTMALAFLDEATSALSTPMEEAMYGRLAETGVTFVSVGHREGLRKFHSVLLRLGQDRAGGWTLEGIKEKDTLHSSTV